MATQHDRMVLNQILNPLLPSEAAAENIAEDEPIAHEGFDASREAEKEGVLLAEKKRLDDAIQKFTQAIELCSTNPSAYNNRAQALRLQAKTDEALFDIEKAIELSKGEGKSACQAFVQRALIRRLQGDDEAAREDYARADKLGSSFAKMQLVAMNPYAAMCNKMLAEVMQNVKEGKE